MNATMAKIYCDKWAAKLPKMLDRETLKVCAVAMEKYDEPWWENEKPSARLGGLQLQEPLLLTSFSLFHESLELFMGRPVWTHELAQPQKLLAEKRDGTSASMQEIMEKIPAEKRLVVALPPAE